MFINLSGLFYYKARERDKHLLAKSAIVSLASLSLETTVNVSSWSLTGIPLCSGIWYLALEPPGRPTEGSAAGGPLRASGTVVARSSGTAGA